VVDFNHINKNPRPGASNTETGHRAEKNDIPPISTTTDGRDMKEGVYYTMRHFVYLNTDILNSYLSQINDGLITRTMQETSDKTVEMQTNETTSPTSKANVAFKFAIASLETSHTDTGVVHAETLSKADYGKDLIEKILHDNTVEELIASLRRENKLKNLHNCKIGDYLLFSATFDILDLNFIGTLFSAGNRNNLMAILGLDYREETPGDNEGNTNITPTSGLLDVFSMLSLIMPCPQMIFTETCCMPVESKYLREKLQEIRFKYAEDIHVFGKVTGTPLKALSNRHILSREIAGFTQGLIEAQKTFLPNAIKWIVDPIALFFE